MIENLKEWEDIFSNKEWGKYPPIPLVRFVAKNYYNVPDRSKIKILELGAGTGANLWYLAREGFTVYGIEYAKAGVERIIKRFEEEGLTQRIGNIVQGDYFDKLDDFQDDYFDLIIDIASLCCNSFSKSKNIIDKALKKLKKGGRLFSITLGEGTYGLNGDEIDYHMVIASGHLLPNLPTRYTTLEDIYKLYKREETEIEFIHREEYYYSEKEAVKQWVISVKKIK